MCTWTENICRNASHGRRQGQKIITGAPRAAELDRIFRPESERTVSQDWVVRYDNRFSQLQPGGRHYTPAQSKVWVCEGRHGHITIEYRGNELRFAEMVPPTKPLAGAAEGPNEPQRVAVPTARKCVPPRNHPWREAARRVAQQKALRETLPARPSLASPCASP